MVEETPWPRNSTEGNKDNEEARSEVRAHWFFVSFLAFCKVLLMLEDGDDEGGIGNLVDLGPLAAEPEGAISVAHAAARNPGQ